ncbi:MAG: hypothetical protein ACKV2T_17470 [Kofleriaceae bacterium]
MARHPNASRFVRTSYGLVPSSWRELDNTAVRDRILYALDLSYRSRNSQSAKAGDPNEMLWIAVAFEFVEPTAMPPRTLHESDLEHVSVRIDRDIHPEVIDAAGTLVLAERYRARLGLDKQPWNDAFSAFRYEEDDTCDLVEFRDRAPMFEAAFGANLS